MAQRTVTVSLSASGNEKPGRRRDLHPWFRNDKGHLRLHSLEGKDRGSSQPGCWASTEKLRRLASPFVLCLYKWHLPRLSPRFLEIHRNRLRNQRRQRAAVQGMGGVGGAQRQRPWILLASGWSMLLIRSQLGVARRVPGFCSLPLSWWVVH